MLDRMSPLFAMHNLSLDLVFFLLLKQLVLLEFLEDFYIERVKSIGHSNSLMQVCIGLTQSHLIYHMSSSAQSIDNLILFVVKYDLARNGTH